MTKRSHLNLTPKLTLAFVLFAVALLALVGVLAYASGRGGLETATIAALRSTATEKEAALSDWLAERQSNLAQIATAPAVVDDLTGLVRGSGREERQAAHDQLTTELLRQSNGELALLELFVMDRETGQILASTNAREEGSFREDRPYFVHGKTGPYIQNPYYALELQAPAMTLSMPVTAGDGQGLGVLAGRLSLDEMSSIITRRSGQTQTDDAFLVNTSHLFVTQPRLLSDPAVLQRGVHTVAVNDCLAGNSGVVQADDYRGIPALIVYTWLAERQLCLIVKIDQAEALEPVRAFGAVLALIAGGALVTASVLAVGLARTFTRPIRALQGGVARLGQGERDVRLPESSSDELGLLAQAFNTMAANLAEQDRQLRGYTSQLEQKVLERTAALQASEAELRALFAGMSDVILVCDWQGRYLRIAPTNPAQLYKPAPDLIGRRLHEVFPSAQADIFLSWIQRALDGNRTVPIEYALSIDGVEIWFTGTVSPLSEDSVLWVARDVTESRRAEAQLRHSEAALKQAQRVARVGSWSWYIQSDRLEWSDEMYRLFGLAKETFTGSLNEVIARAIHPEDRAAVEGANRSVSQDQQPAPLEYRVVWPDGTVRVVWAEAGEMTLDAGGSPAVLTGIVQDITERKQAEAALRRYAERLSTINRLDHVIASNLDINLVYDNFVQALQALVPLDRTSVVLLNETGDQWQIARQWTRDQPMI